ncbi:helix-turn-helix domain-containing protein [Nocardia abscessus]|uniref:helix-turn-helix domain-containing protein n=1 Tax=Nocardia abscessus TaxID=120957 RepID=UPI0009FE3F23|nr:helix-turn-helix transcriptional regulator [Nocardia abscessus]MCC3326615.1 helix-turn-helix transcriptional regulator [Nocardia abscessus]
MKQGSILRTAREARGVKLRAMAALTNYSPAYLSLIESGKRPVPQRIVDAYERVLGTDLGRLSTVAGSAANVDASSLREVATMLASMRRIEDATGPVAVLPAVQGIGKMAESFAEQANSALAKRSAMIASEISQYRGWLELVTGADTASRQSLARAVQLAEAANGPDQLAHALSFTAYASLARNQWHEAESYAEVVMSVAQMHPLIRVYENYQLARVHAVSGNTRAAQHTLILADKAAEDSEGEEPPEAGYWYTMGFWCLQRARVLWILGQHERARDEVQHGLAEMPESHRSAEWATKWVRAANGETAVPH